MKRPLRARFTPEAAALIGKLHPVAKRMIRSAIRSLKENPYQGHELQLDLAGFRSFRVRTYRIIFYLNDEKGYMEVYYVGHRRDIYESFRELLMKHEISSE